MNLWFDLFKLPSFTHKGSVDFIVEVADVTDYSTGFNGLQHVGITHVGVACGGDDKVCGAH